MTGVSVPEAFVLLTIPSASLTTNGFTQSGDFQLQHITATVPDPTGAIREEVYLVLRLRDLEIVLDPDRRVSLNTADPQRRTYTFSPTATDTTELRLAVPASTPAHDLETLDIVLAQYAARFDGAGPNMEELAAAGDAATAMRPPPHIPQAQADKLRGHLVLVNEDSGEIVGQMDQRFPVQEDPALRGSKDPVVVEVPDEDGLAESDANARAMFVRAIPPEQQNWLTKGAGFASYAISTSATLLVKGMGAAADYYVANAAKSPHHPEMQAAAAANTTGASSSKNGLAGDKSTPPTLPSRTVTMLTSERTRENMRLAHKYTGTAVKASAKTVSAVDGLIRRAVYGKEKDGKGKEKATAVNSVTSQYSPAPSIYSPAPSQYSSSPSQFAPAPPPYTPPTSGQPFLAPEKPKLPPRRTPSPMGKGGLSSSSSPAAPYIESPKSMYPSGPAPPWASPNPGHASDAGYAPYPVYAKHDGYGPPPTGQGPPPGAGARGAGTHGTSAEPPPLPPRELKTKDRVILSADLILSTIDDSTRQLIEAGVINFGKVMGHKYGKDAGETSTMAARTAQNVGLVYIDMSGLGRRALVKRVGKHYVKSKFSSKGKAGKS